MRRLIGVIPALFVLSACDGNSGNGQTTSNSNNQNNSSNSNNAQCPGTAPEADLHEGVCADAVKVCDAASGTWIEPDYSLISGYEADEVTCDGLDNDCDGQQDEDLTTPFYTDADGDGFGDQTASATLACQAPDGQVADNSDCDDSTVTGAACHEGCNMYYQDQDNDGHGDPDQSISSCAPPAGYVEDDLDCAPADGNHWNDCGSCTDADGDGYGQGCDLGSDCDDSAATGGACHDGCAMYYQDSDNDGHGDPNQSISACSIPTGYVADNSDCSPSDSAHWADCGTCTDADHDDYGQGCDLGSDCDDSAATGGACHDGCTTYYQDSDNDNYGDPNQSVSACSPPAGYVADNSDCAPSDSNRHPGVMEICDGIDNDCDGVVDAGQCQAHASCDDKGETAPATCSCDDGYVEISSQPGICQPAVAPSAGDLAITEIMIQPMASASTAEGQYFEIVNTTDATLNLTNIEFTADNGTETGSTVLSADTILAPHDYFVVSVSDDESRNGGLAPNYLFTGMPELNAAYGEIDIWPPNGSSPIDMVLWDSTWNHAQGASLDLSIGALTGNPADLNDQGRHWCHHRFSSLPAGDYGTPGRENDDCLVTWCNVQWPTSTSTTVGQSTESIYGQVYEAGITDSSGQGPFLLGQLGYGPQDSVPGNDWSWTTASYNTDSGNNDEYVAVLNPQTEGTFDYAYRMSMDDGLTWQLCDHGGTSHDGAAYDPSDSGVLTVDSVAWSQVALGFYHSCAAATNGNSYCWGENSWGQLGDGATDATTMPSLVLGGHQFSVLTAGAYHTCGLTDTGTAYCWGWNDYGQLGDNSQTNRSLPGMVSGGLTFASISGGYNHTCGITDNGAAYCWGYNGYGQLGDNSTTQRLVPTAVADGHVFVRLATGWSHSCGIANDGNTYCWGRNNNGQLGDNTTSNRPVPTLVHGGLHFTAIYAGDYHTCAIADNGNQYCWGKGATGQLGNGSQTDRHLPTLVSGSLDLQSMEGGGGHTCGVASDAAAYCWGDNGNGQIGDGSPVTKLTPSQVTGGHTFSEIAAGERHSCGVTRSGDILCWGYNGHGELGNGSTTNAYDPTMVITPW